MGPYLGDYEAGTLIHFCWDTNSKYGASITRQVNGTVKVYKDNGAEETTFGITDIEDFDSLTGVHNCRIDLSSDAFYSKGHDYSVVLAGAIIDGVTVNATLASFSIENRFPCGSLFVKAAKVLVNKASQNKLSGAITYYDDDGETVILTQTPVETESTITRTPS